MNAGKRGYWYEQYRRSAFDFDSQDVRPYFPYAQVEQGILDTAGKLLECSSTDQRNLAGTRMFRSGMFWIKMARHGRPVLSGMHPREGKDKWFSATPVVTGVRGRVSA